MKFRLLQAVALLLFLVALPHCLLAQPANDNCADAISVGMGTPITFSTIDATTDGPFHPNSPCPSSASDSIFSDIWFVHTAVITGELRWTLCGTADFDSRIAVYQAGATCPMTDADLLTCNEDGPAACTNFESEVDFDVVVGETYYLRLGGFGSEEPGAQGGGSFTISEAPQGLANDDCENAQVITLGAAQPVTNNGATTDGPIHPNDPICFGFNDNTAQSDVWFSFTSPVTGLIEWSTCNTVNWDSRLVVYGPNVACPVSADQMIACSDATPGCAGYSNILNFDVTIGATYLLRVGGWMAAEGSGTFDLLEITPPVPPANDLCTNSDSVFVMSEEDADDFTYLFEGTIINSTVSGSLVDPTCVTAQGGKYPDVWYRFNNLGNETVEIRYFSEMSGTGFIIEILENCNGDTIVGNSCFTFTPDDYSLLVDTISGLSSVPTEYLVRVTGYLFWPPGSFVFQLVGDIPNNTGEAAFPGQVALSPNPVSGQLYLDLNLATAADTKVRVVNVLGQSVLEKDFGELMPGRLTEFFDTGSLSAGVYTLIVQANQSKKALKFTKM